MIESLILLLIIILLVPALWKTFKKKYRSLRFNMYITFFYILFLLIGAIYNIPIKYILGGTFLFYVTRVYIMMVRSIKIRFDSKTKKEKEICEFDFFIYLLFFSIIIFAYITSFSIFYFNAIPMGNKYLDAYFLKEGRFIKLNFLDSIYYSGFTFFSFEFDNLEPQGLLKVVIFLELFVAQIAIIVFIGILASYLLTMLRL